MTTQPIIKSFSPELQAAARRHSVGNDGYPFDALQVGQAFELPLDTVDLRHLRSRITANNKTGKNFFHVVVRAKNIVEVGRLPDVVAAQKTAQDVLSAPSYKPPADSANGWQPAFAPAVPRVRPSFVTSTPVNDLPEEDTPSPWLAMQSAGKLANVTANAGPAAAWMPPAPVPVHVPAQQSAPTGFLGIPTTLLHLTAAAAHDAHVKEQYRRFGVASFDEMTDDQIAQAQAAIETADANWEASNVKPDKFPDTSKMSFDAKKTKPTAPAPRTPEQLAKHNNRPIMSDEEQAAMAKLAEDAKVRWYAEKAEEDKNPQPPKVLSW